MSQRAGFGGARLILPVDALTYDSSPVRKIGERSRRLTNHPWLLSLCPRFPSGTLVDRKEP